MKDTSVQTITIQYCAVVAVIYTQCSTVQFSQVPHTQYGTRGYRTVRTYRYGTRT